ncbi:MAG TPA: hypothetical protein PKJ21_09315, partial [Anaerolineae bacterium]|nr:hypothetical protein [Anaerolineae bacterium]
MTTASSDTQPNPDSPPVAQRRLTNGTIAVLGAACLVLGLIAQRSLDTAREARSGLLLYALA